MTAITNAAGTEEIIIIKRKYYSMDEVNSDD